jgi:hypothetical protein
MPIKKAFYVEDYDEVLASMPDNFKRADFFKGVMATMPAKGPEGEDTTTEDFKKQVKCSVGNWLHRKAQAGMIKKAKRTGWQVVYAKPGAKKEQPQAPKEPTTAPEEPQDGLTLLDIGKGIEALINHIRGRRDYWKKLYYDQLRTFEDLSRDMRDLKTDKENLNRRLDKQNNEILRLTNEARRSGQSTVKLSEVARFKTKNAGAGRREVSTEEVNHECAPSL